MKIPAQVVAVSLLAFCTMSSTAQTIMEIIDTRPELTQFRTALLSIGADAMLQNSSSSFTVFAPSDLAAGYSDSFQLYLKGKDEKPLPRWHLHLQALLKNHMLANQSLTADVIFDATTTVLNSTQDPIEVSQFQRKVGGAGIEVPDLRATNGVLHVVDAVISPIALQNDLSAVEIQPELGDDWMDPPRVGLGMVLDVVGNKSRNFYSTVREEGQTQVACRRRAFNRMGLFYLPQTINDSNDVKMGELMNTSYTNETYDEFIQYSVLPKNYYYDDIPKNYMELTYGANDCSHVWVTKDKKGRLCYNDGCAVNTGGFPAEDGGDPPREFLTSNGVGLIVDKCILCSGVAMLTAYAADYTIYDVDNVAQFFVASEWNLRELSQSVGDGGKITLFAAADSGWDLVNSEDITRLTTDKWKLHQWDFLSHMMVQGAYTIKDLKDKYAINQGPYNLTSLAGEPLFFDFDESRSQLTIQGGDVVKKDIKGVDGYVHFTSEVPLPLSMTDTVYDVAKKRPIYSTQVGLIDTVFLTEDMKRLLPLTAMYSPNSVWENKIIELEDISKMVLESHVFKELQWCDELRKMEGKNLTSLNGLEWKISINEDNMPCFDTYLTAGGGSTFQKACITKCDILARNGIVHELDNIMMSEVGETLAPRSMRPIAPTARRPSPPTVARPTYFGGNEPRPTRQAPSAVVDPSKGSSAAAAYRKTAAAAVIALSLVILQL